MDLLVLGGTAFVGRHVAEAALAAGHRVTLFNRGRTNPGLFPAARHLTGDRAAGDYSVLRGAGPFDAVVDTSAYVPRHVREALAALDGALGRYVFVSSISAYAGPGPSPGGAGFVEESPLAGFPPDLDSATEDVTEESYGPLKVTCEETAEALLPGRVTAVRPGLVVGPHDPTDRFTYWVRRVSEGGEVLAPEGPEVAQTQFVDARDLGQWIVRLAGNVGPAGAYNAVAPRLPLTEVLEAARAASGSDARLTWVPWPFLERHGVTAWTDLPAWVPRELAGYLATDGSKAAAAGLTSRPIKAVVADLLAWDRTRPPGTPLGAGLSRKREAELLSLWALEEKAAGRAEPAPPPGP